MATAKRKKSAVWSAEKYRFALLGEGDFAGLRSWVKGFDASEGYNLHNIKNWSSHKRARVRDYYERVYSLHAQQRRAVRPRNKRNLQRLHEAYHGDIASSQFKVAFVPDVEPQRLPGAKRSPLHIAYRKDAIVLDRGIYQKKTVFFDRQALARDADSEIDRVIQVLGPQKLYYIQTGEYQSISDRSPLTLIKQIKQWMLRYNGATPLKGKKAGENPANHAWWNWLVGINGYAFERRIAPRVMTKAISDGRETARFNRRVNGFKADMTPKQRVGFDVEYAEELKHTKDRWKAAAKASARVKVMKKYR